MAYVKRISAERSVAYWNRVLAYDPVFGPSSGMIVGVAPVWDADENRRRYQLVWVPAS